MQFGAGILAVVFNLKPELRALRVGANIVAFSVLTATIVSTIRGSLAVLEWYLVSLLVLILPFYISWPIRLGHIEKNRWRYVWIFKNPSPQLPTWKTFWLGWFEALLWRCEFDKFATRDPKTKAFLSLKEEKEYAQDYLPIGALFLLYTAYLGILPWLYFMRAYQGHKTGCVVKLYAAFVYVDVHGNKWITLMRVGTVLGLICAVVTLYASVYCLAKGAHQWLQQLREEARKNRPKDMEPGLFKDDLPKIASIHEDEDQDWKTTIPKTEDQIRRKDFYIAHKARFYFYYYVVKTFTHFTAALPAVVGAAVIVFVEYTISYNKIDLSGYPLTSTGQLLPFLVGIITSVNVISGLIFKARARWEKEKRHIKFAFKTTYENIRDPVVQTSKEKARATKKRITDLNVAFKAAWTAKKKEIQTEVKKATQPVILRLKSGIARTKARVKRTTEPIVLNLKTMAESVWAPLARSTQGLATSIGRFFKPRRRTHRSGQVPVQDLQASYDAPSPPQPVLLSYPRHSTSGSSTAPLNISIPSRI